MNRTILSLLVLLLLGLYSQPSIAQSRQQLSQQQAEKNVAQMSEEQMREYLPQAKERLKEAQSALKTGNYSKYYSGDDALAQGVAKAAAESLYYYLTAAINAIEKRLHKIDSQKPKPQTEQQQPEPQTEQQQQEIPGRTSEQVQADLQRSYEKNLGETQARYNENHKMVDSNAHAAMNEHVAAELVRGNRDDSNFKRVTNDMLDKPLSTNSKTNSGERDGRIGISGKFPKPKSEEPQKEEPKEKLEKNKDLDAEIRKLLQELENDISNFPKEDL